MRGAAFRAIRDADVIVHLADARDGLPPLLWSDAGWEGDIPTTPVLVVLNKTDSLSPAALRALTSDHPNTVLISARTGDSVDALLARLRTLVPEGPFLYPADDASTQNLRFFVSEMVRETALEELNDEIPHALACVVEESANQRRRCTFVSCCTLSGRAKNASLSVLVASAFVRSGAAPGRRSNHSLVVRSSWIFG